MLNGKLENSFISGQDKETLRRTRTERQNYEEISKEFRERIVKDLNTKELQSLSKNSSASLLSIQAMMKVQGSYLRNIDNNLKRLVKINDNFIKALTKNLSLGTRINLGGKASLLGSYATDNRKNIIKDNKEYANLSNSITTFTDVIKKLDERQRERTNEVLSMLSEVPTDLSTNISMAVDKTLRDHPMLRKVYGTLSATAGTAFNWTKQGISEILGLPANVSLGSLTKIASWNVTGKWEREVKINKSLPLQTLISLLSSIQKQTWLINNDTLKNIQDGYKSSTRELEDKGGLKRFADSFGPGLKTFLKSTALASLLFPNTIGAASLFTVKGTLGLTTFIGKIGISILTLLGKGLINYPTPSILGITAATMILNRAKANAKRLADNEKKLSKMRSEAQGNWFNPDYETIKVGGKILTEKDRSKTWAGYIKEEFTKGFWRESLSKGFGKTIGGLWKSIFNQDALRKEREANDKDAELKAIENFKIKFMTSIAKKGQDVADAIIGLKEAEYDIKLMRQQVVGKSNFNQIEETKKLIADLKAQQKFAEDDNNEGTFRGSVIKGIMWLGGKGKDLLGKGVDKLNQKYTWANNISTNVKDKFDKGKDWVSDKYTKGKNWLSGKISDKVKGNALSIWDFFTDSARPKEFFKDWWSDELYGSDRGKDFLNLIQGENGKPGLLEQLQEMQSNASKTGKGTHFTDGFKDISNIRKQLWYKEKNTFANVLFNKIDYLTKNIIGEDINDETKIFGLLKRIYTETSISNEKGPGGKTLKYIIRGALDNDLSKTNFRQYLPDPDIHLYERLDKWLEKEGIDNIQSKAVATMQYTSSNMIYGNQANQQLKNAAKGKGNHNTSTKQPKTLTDLLTSKTDPRSLFFKVATDIHKIAQMIKAIFNRKLKLSNGQFKGIPYFATGALVNGPTLAMTGEAGPEKVQPLTGPIAEEVHRQEAKGIFGYLKDYFNEGYERADKYNFNRFGSTVEGLLNAGFKGSGHLMYNAAMAVVELPNTLKKITEKVDAVDQVLTGKASVISGSFIDKVSKGFDFVDGGLAKLIKPITKIDNLWPESNESFMSVLLRNTSDIIGDKAKVIGKGLQGWSVKALNWIDQTAQGKTKTGKRLYAFGNYLKNDLDTFKKRWKNTYEPFFKDPLTAIFAKSGTKLPFFISMISKAILPVAGIGIFYLLSSSKVKGAITKFFTELIPNLFKKGLFRGTIDNLGNMASIMPTLSEKAAGSSGHIIAGAKLFGGRLVAGGMDLMSIYNNVSSAATHLGEGNYSDATLSTLESLNDFGRTAFSGLMEYLHIMPYNIASAAYEEFSKGAANLVASNGENAKEQKELAWYQHMGNQFGQGVQAITKFFHGDKEGARKSIASALNSMDQNAENFKYVPLAGQINYLSSKATKVGAWGLNKLFGVGTNPFDTLEDQYKSIDKMYKTDKEKEMPNAEFLKIRSKQYGFKDVNKLPLDKQKTLRFMINQLESPEASKNMSPMEREKLKFEIASLGNSEYIVKLGADGEYAIDKSSFTTKFMKSDEFKGIKEFFEKYKDRKMVKRAGAGYTNNGGVYKSFLSGELFKGDVNAELGKMLTWLKNEYGPLYVNYFEMLPDQRKAIYLNQWMDWRYPENMNDYIPERGLSIAEAIRREGKEIVRKRHEVKAVTPALKLALKNLDNRDGSDTHKMQIRLRKDNSRNIFGNQTNNSNSQTQSNTSASKQSEGTVSAVLGTGPKSPNNIAETLAASANNVALSMGGKKSLHKCTTGVKKALVKAGILQSYPWGKDVDEAWEMANFLNKTGKFYDITNKFPNKEDIINAPRGSVIVWGKSADKPIGHVEIALGNGQTASDFLWSVPRLFATEKANNAYYGPAKVFYPIGNEDKEDANNSDAKKDNGSFFGKIVDTITGSDTYKAGKAMVNDAVNAGKAAYHKYVPEDIKNGVDKMTTMITSGATDAKRLWNEKINPSMKRASNDAWQETINSKNWGNEYRQFNRFGWDTLFSSGEQLDRDSLGVIQGDVQKVYDQWSKKWGYYNDSEKAKESWERLINDLGPGQKAFANMYFQKLSEKANPIMTEYNQAKSKAKEILEKGMEVVADKGNQLLEEGNEQGKEMVKELKEIKKAIVESKEVKDLKEAAKPIINNITNATNNVANTVTNSVSNAIDYGMDALNSTASGTFDILGNMNQ